MKAYINEGIRFLKKYFSKILWIGLVLGLILGGLLYFRSQTIEETEEATEDFEIEVSEDSLENRIEPAYFQFYVVQPNGNNFTNRAIIEDIFNLEDVREEALDVTGVNIERVEEMINEKREESETTTTEEQEDHKVVRVRIDDASNVMTAVFDSANQQNNLSLANYYYDLLFEEGLNVLNEYSLYSIMEPKLVEFPTEEELDEAGAEIRPETSSFSIVRFAVNVAIGMVFSFLLLIALFLLKELFSRKLNFAFTYDRGNAGSFLVYDSNLSSPEVLNYFIGQPYSEEKVILSEEKLEGSLTQESNTAQNNLQSLLDANSIQGLEEIIFIVKANETSRIWYENQLELAKMKNIPIKIVQVNP